LEAAMTLSEKNKVAEALHLIMGECNTRKPFGREKRDSDSALYERVFHEFCELDHVELDSDRDSV
jgi:hypothetical protein